MYDCKVADVEGWHKWMYVDDNETSHPGKALICNRGMIGIWWHNGSFGCHTATASDFLMLGKDFFNYATQLANIIHPLYHAAWLHPLSTFISLHWSSAASHRLVLIVTFLITHNCLQWVIESWALMAWRQLPIMDTLIQMYESKHHWQPQSKYKLFGVRYYWSLSVELWY